MNLTPLQKTAQAVIDRWDSPAWKDQPHTAEYIAELRKALVDGLGEVVEPFAYALVDKSGCVVLDCALARHLNAAADTHESDAQQATPDIKALQAKGKGPAPCARFCEANAFQIEIRRLTAEINAQQAKRVQMTPQEITEMATQEQFLLVCDGLEELTQIVRSTEQHHDITPADKPTVDEPEDLYALALKADNWGQP